MRHSLVDSPDCSKEEKAKIKREKPSEWQKKQEEGNKNGGLKSNESVDNREGSVVFACTYAERKRDYVTADIEADANLRDDAFLQIIMQDDGKVTVKELKEPRILNAPIKSTKEDNEVQVSCRKIPCMNVELRIKHGKTLVLRNVK